MADPVEIIRTIVRGDDEPLAAVIQHAYVVLGPDGATLKTLPWDEELRQGIAETLHERPDLAKLERLGQHLYALLGDVYEQSLNGPTGAPVRVGLQLSSGEQANELFSLPFELLRSPGSGRRLAASEHVLICYRALNARAPLPDPLPSRPIGRVLFGCFGPNLNRIRDRQILAIQKAFGGVGAQFVQAEDVVTLSFEEVEARLKSPGARGPYSALHILCHGGPLPASEAGYGLVWRDGVHAGARLAELLAPYADTLRLVVISSCLGSAGAPEGLFDSAALALHKLGIEAVIGARTPITTEGSILLTSELYGALVGGTVSVEEAFVAARQALWARWPAGLDHLALQLFTHDLERWDTRPFVHRPYRGLERFREQDAHFFFGRDKEISETVADLEALVAAGRRRFLIVAGASGTGKSSLVLAGVLPELRRRGWGIAEVLRPSELDPGRWKDQVNERLGDARGGPGVVLVVDQLEEIFTTLDAKTRQDLMQDLWELSCQASPVVAVLTTLRVDFIGRCGEIVIDQDSRLDHVAYDELHRVFIERIGPAGLRRAIEEPARLVGLVLEDGLAARVAEDVESEAGALPLVQHAMDRLWHERKSRALVWPVGGVRGALEQHATAVYEALSEPERTAARRILLELVQVKGDRGAPVTKLRLTRDRVVGSIPEAESTRVLDRLIDERLLVSEGSKEAEGGAWIEIAHEALITHWETFAGWLETARDMKAATGQIQGWADDPDRFPHLNQQQLHFAHQVDEQYPGELSESARELIRRSEVEAADARRREEERVAEKWKQAEAKRKNTTRIALALLLVIVALGLMAWNSTTARIQAKREATRAMDRSLMLAAAQGGDQPLLKAVLLREVARPREANSWMEHAAALAWTPLPEKVLGGFDAGVTLARFTPDGKRVLTQGRDGWTLWPVEGPGPGVRLEGALEEADQAEFSRDGRALLLSGGRALGVQLWSLKGEKPYQMVWLRDGVISALLSPDGSRVVNVMKDGSARVLDTDLDAEVALLQGKADRIEQARFSGSSDRVVTYTKSGLIQLWRVNASAVPELICDGRMGSKDNLPNAEDALPAGAGEPPSGAEMMDKGPFFSPLGGLVVAHFGGESGQWRIVDLQSMSCESVSVSDDDLPSNPPVFAAPVFADDDRSVVFISQRSDPWGWTAGVGLRKIFDAPTGSWFEVSPTISSDSRALLTLSTDRRLSRWSFDLQEPPTDLGTVCDAPLLVQAILEDVETSAIGHQLQRWCTDALTAVSDLTWTISVDGARVLTRSSTRIAALWTPQKDSLPIPLADLGRSEAFGPTASYSADQEDVVAIRRDCKRPPLDSGRTIQTCQSSYSALRIGRKSLVAHEAALEGEWWPTLIKVEQGGFFGRGPDDGLMISAPDQWDGARTIHGELLPFPSRAFEHIFSVTGGRFLTIKSGDLVIAQMAYPDRDVALGHCPKLYFAALSLDGRHVVAGCSEDNVRTWVIDEAGAVGPAVTIPVKEAPQRSELSRTGQWLALFGDGMSWVVRSDGSGALRAVGFADEVIFSSDDRYAISLPSNHVDQSRPIGLWRLDGADEAQEIPVRNADIRTLAFSPDSTRIRVLLNDATVREFSVADPTKPLAIYAGPPLARGAVQERDPTFSADLNHILTTSSTGFVREWPVWNHEQVLEALWRATPYCLPPEERRVRLQENDEEADARFAACQARVKACQDPEVKNCSTFGERHK